jgi:hypothetical protein
MRLGSFVGKAVLVDIPMMSEEGPQWYTLDDVEPAGLWLRSDVLSERLPIPRTPDGSSAVAIFVPFSHIRFMFGTAGRIPPTEEEFARLREAAAAAEKPTSRRRAETPSARSRRSRSQSARPDKA